MFLLYRTLLIATVFVTLCSGGTVPQRASGIIGTGSVADSTKKTGKVMHSAFQNAGQTKGLEIWRIEVSSNLLYIQRFYFIIFIAPS